MSEISNQTMTKIMKKIRLLTFQHKFQPIQSLSFTEVNVLGRLDILTLPVDKGHWIYLPDIRRTEATKNISKAKEI